MHDGKAVFFSDDAWCPLRGEVNSPNSQYWSGENSGLTRELPLHDKKMAFIVRYSARHEISAVVGQRTSESKQRVSQFY